MEKLRYIRVGVRLCVILAVTALVSACAEKIPLATSGLPDNLIQCTNPRPEMCTMDYRPVCGIRDTGVRCVTTPCDSTELMTYGNGCQACGDAAVIGYSEGACAE